MPALAGALAILAFLLPGSAGAQTPDRVVEADSARAIHLLSRATWGVRSEDVGSVLEMGPEAWLAKQMSERGSADPALEARLERFPAASMPIADLMREYAPPRQPRPAQGDSAGDGAASQAERRARAMRSPQRILVDLVGARLTRAVHAERQLEDVMIDFWYNHFNVFFNKGIDRYLVGDYERTAIRPHVFGRFEDMLRATAEHPAMLFYLDNVTNLAPDSMSPARGRAANRRQEMARRIGTMSEDEKEALIRSGRITREQIERMEQAPVREPGINENYARELLELHTLGVDGGYTQDDVIAVARAFTGWTLDRNGGRMAPAMGEAPGTPRFVFRPMLHDVREKTVLGVTLPANRGMEDGRDVLRLLAMQPGTARHIARKLVERFISDAGDQALEDTLAAVFLRTSGDLGAVTRTLFTSERFFAPEHRRSKVKTPFELVASTLRVLHADFGPSPELINTLRSMGHLPYAESAPTGFPAASADWVSSGAMLARMNFALDLSGGRVRGVRTDGSRLTQGTATDDALGRFITNVLPGVDPEPIEARVREDLMTQSEAERQTLARRAVGLVLGSPEFQRR
jgi:uncharacterized protein (DUF1800 family)